MTERYLIVSIDTECDKGAGWRVEKPLAFAGIRDGVAARLQPLFAKYKAKPTYLLSPEVIRDDESRAIFDALARAKSAELGTHLHGELAEPGAFVPDKTDAFQRDYPESEERAKLTSLTNDFTRAFGFAPRSFRAGRFGIGESSLGILEDLGYAVESSVTPHMEWSSAGAKGLDFRGAPSQPYHPDPRDPKRAGSSKLWEVPVTIRPRTRVPLLRRFVEPTWLRPTRGTKEALVGVARAECQEAIERAPDRPVILTAMFHNVEIVPGKSPYAKDEGEARAILDRLEALLRFCESESIAVIGLADVAEILDRAEHRENKAAERSAS